MNNALDYIENNLDKDIDLTEIAKIACQSVSNFQRMFSIIADIPLSEYIRRRRLTLAAFDLQNTNKKIIDIALKYDYDSPEAFTRAFNIIHGVAPSAARAKGIRLKAYPRISFLLTVKGVIAMDYRIEKRDAFSVYGLEDVYNFDNIQNKDGRSIPQVWQDICENGEFEKLAKSTSENWHSEGSFSNDVGVVFAYDSYKCTSNTTFPYLIGCFRTTASNTSGYTIVDVPASTWAIFPTFYVPGKLDLTTLKKRIFTEWIQTSKYKILDGGNFEMYCKNNNEEYCELWFRVEEI
jgi:AraC family transcriptional regulator